MTTRTPAVACLVALISFSAMAQPTAADRTRAALQEIVDSGTPGVGAAVMVGGKVTFADGVGFADVEAQVPITAKTRFRIASVSKSITAALMLRLVDQKKLDLNSSVRTHLPDLAERYEPVTLRRLAGHLGGIRHYRGQEFLSTIAYPTVSSALGVFINDPFAEKAGAKYHYTTYGFTLLSAALEKAGGGSFLELLQQHVLAPLEMAETGPDEWRKVIPYRARGYEKDSSGALANAPSVDNSNKWAGGGLVATLSDLGRFGQAHVRPGFLSEATWNQLFVPGKNADQSSTHYSLGWGTGMIQGNERYLSHSGGAIGGSSFLLVLPDRGVVVALAANRSQSSLNLALARRIADHWKSQ